MISIIIPTYKRGDIFYECIESVVDSVGLLDEIIVVNDFKEKELDLDQIDRKGKKVKVINNPKQGVASARNYGAKYAKGDVLLFIDDDMLINSDAIEKCLETLKSSDKLVVNADWIYFPKELERIKDSQFGRYLVSIDFTSLKGWNNGLNWQENSTIKANGITSQFFMIQKKDFEFLGGYNENFPFAGFEDSELYVRIKNSGYQPIIDTRCLIYHNEKDRMDLKPFLDRKYRGAVTRRKAVDLGFDDFVLEYSYKKKIYYIGLEKVESILRFLIEKIPNNKLFDNLYAKLVNQQIGLNIYKGYTAE
ncbi:glycosyltransferase family 2 protein [Brumimicrobium oceani]|uniref:Glycosyltransferase 2-like domain-containing protein n=1 Tax=Brumimicrobium oceani TaxID=2100725 RepID=A0A2U2XC89_9FLAO|nr:glycosyltransferase [Brumimicrobium oceani]PWH85321.1 hypothetical protein DIT68_10315 [Brumimicrobium oceani]